MTLAARNRRGRGRTMGQLVLAAAFVASGVVTPAVAGDHVERVTLVMDEFRFKPNVLHFQVGEDVVLTIRNLSVTDIPGQYESGMSGLLEVQ